MESDLFDEQTRDKSDFDWLSVSSVCRLGSDKYPDSYINQDFAENNFHDAFYGTESSFRKHTEDRVMKSFIDSFGRSYNCHVVDISNQKDHFGALPFSVV